MRTSRRWRLDLESEVAVLPAPSKSTADDYAGLLLRGDDYAVGAVCDGVTGREGQGGVAAAHTLEALRVLDWPEPVGVRAVEQRLVEAIRGANAGLLRENRARQRNGSPPTTTCTLGAVYVHAGRCYATTAWVGDSPAEVVTPYEMRAITPTDSDHAASAPAALGVREDLAVEVRSVAMAAGQALLLHSDGFSLDGGECLRVYKNTIGDRHGWAKFLEQAMQRSQPSNDDKSALVIGIVGEPEEQAVPEPERPRVALEPTRAEAPVRPRARGWRPALVVPLVLIVGAAGWLAGHFGLGVPARARPAGISALGEPFAVGSGGSVLSLSSLVGAKGKMDGGTWPVYTLESGDKGPELVPAGRLSLTPTGSTAGAVLALGVMPPKGSRIYVDGVGAQPPVSIAPEETAPHKVEIYSDKPATKWGCEVTASAEGPTIKPLKVRPEPR